MTERGSWEKLSEVKNGKVGEEEREMKMQGRRKLREKIRRAKKCYQGSGCGVR